jgi:CheY-like chemotaxis protein
MSVSILIVDDEPDVAELFRQRFRRENPQGIYALDFATSGEEALDRLAGHIQPQRQSEMPLAFGIGLDCGPA